MNFDLLAAADPLAQFMSAFMGMVLKVILLLLGVGILGVLFQMVRRRLLFGSARDLDAIRRMTWREFELLISEFYRRQGCRVIDRGGAQADGGVDLVVQSGGGKMLVQCKWRKTARVGVVPLRELYGVMMHEKADSAALVTTGTFTQQARDFVAGKPIQLIPGKELIVMIQSVKGEEVPAMPQGVAGERVATESPAAFSAASETPACPVCGSAMVLRTAKRGQNAGNVFYGCRRYPGCRGIVNLPS